DSAAALVSRDFFTASSNGWLVIEHLQRYPVRGAGGGETRNNDPILWGDTTGNSLTPLGRRL
ncbi:hypothetical protein, partial [Arachnia propionica]|uniref:hypothetical protein n=1 Tax=Arachnia propionica TaxID=1750 RepID=UPI003C6F29D4